VILQVLPTATGRQTCNARQYTIIRRLRLAKNPFC
jgi:hypothetical protein